MAIKACPQLPLFTAPTFSLVTFSLQPQRTWRIQAGKGQPALDPMVPSPLNTLSLFPPTFMSLTQLTSFLHLEAGPATTGPGWLSLCAVTVHTRASIILCSRFAGINSPGCEQLEVRNHVLFSLNGRILSSWHCA